MRFGPFEMTVERVESLGASFTPFVNRLLEVEQSASRIEGHRLSVSDLESVADGGVDAVTREAVATDWMPAGDTAWQFKRGDLEPAKCKKELRDALWAHHFISDGGTYVLVLGKGLTDQKRESRRRALVAQAMDLGLIASDDPSRIRVYDGNQLARWTSTHPSLAVSRLANGPGQVAIDFASWAGKASHQKQWTPDPMREAAISSLRDRIIAPGNGDIRVHGDSGIGKTRLVLEALRGEAFSPLVAYVDDPTGLTGELLEHLVDSQRAAILVIDDCPAERHAKLVDKLPEGTVINLITIGPSGPAITPTPVITVEPMPAERVDAFLKTNFPGLGAEARRFVAVHTDGNLRWTIVVAERVGQMAAAQAAELIRRDDITAFITSVLPEGTGFFCATVLALFDRIGWDRELRYQLELLAEFSGRSVADFESVGKDLEQRGLMTRHGRLRAIEPHPLGVFLAAEGWRTEGHRIVSELLPRLDGTMALALFRRIADLGRFEPTQAVLSTLLGGGGPFSSLSRIEEGRYGPLLTQLAIVMPERVALHLSEQIERQTLDELRGHAAIRRDLVWTLEKLAWHQSTFEKAANSLLRLALAEIETYSNNATGTWLSLFGTMLPGTAAKPPQRAAYLRQVASNMDPSVRRLAVKAASHTFAHHEMITVSAEVQGGVLVEPRGTPSYYRDALEYHLSAVEVLDDLARDSEPEIAQDAVEALIGSLSVLLGEPSPGQRLVDVLASLTGLARVRLRAEVDSLGRQFDRVPPRDPLEIERLATLIDRLQPAGILEQIQVLVGLHRWDLDDGKLQSDIDVRVQTLGTSEVAGALSLLDTEVAAAWELGYALGGRSSSELPTYLHVLVDRFETNPAALPGLLTRLVDAGQSDAFDTFLDSDLARGLDDPARLFVAVRGPVTSQSRALIFATIDRLPIPTGVNLLFGWHGNLLGGDVRRLLDRWSSRIAEQHDYNALIDWLSLWLHGQGGNVPDAIRPRVLELILLRKRYPGLSQQRWGWARIGEAFIESNPIDIAAVILDSIETGDTMIHEGDDDSNLLIAFARQNPAEFWHEVARRLEAGSWRLQMEIGGWLLGTLPVETIAAWMGDAIDRARLVASVAPAGKDEPTPLARYLLEHFGTDRGVSSSLWANFISGVRIGPESAHLSQQIDQLNAWRSNATEPMAVREWAANTVENLERRRALVQEWESEDSL